MSTRESKLEGKIAILQVALSAGKSKNRQLNQGNKSLAGNLVRNKQKAGRIKAQLRSELKKTSSGRYYP